MIFPWIIASVTAFSSAIYFSAASFTSCFCFSKNFTISVSSATLSFVIENTCSACLGWNVTLTKPLSCSCFKPSYSNTV